MKKIIFFIISLILFCTEVKADSYRFLEFEGNKNIDIKEKSTIAFKFEFTLDSEPNESNNFNTINLNYRNSDSNVLQIKETLSNVSFPKGTYTFSYVLELTGIKKGSSEVCVSYAPCFNITVNEKVTTTSTKKVTTNVTTSTKKVTVATEPITEKRNVNTNSQTTTTTKTSTKTSININTTTTTASTQEISLIPTEETTSSTKSDDKLNYPNLDYLIIKNHKIDFQTNIFDYTIDVLEDETTLNIETKCNENYICQNEEISIKGKNEIIVSVFDSNGLQTDYKIMIKRQKKKNYAYFYIALGIILILCILIIICYQKRIKKNKKDETIMIKGLE